MYCSKCKFTSSDHLPKCPKCGFDWQNLRLALQLDWLQSEGHDWFKHIGPPVRSDNVFARTGEESEDFLASADDTCLAPTGDTEPTQIVPETETVIQEVTFAGLPDELEATVSESELAIEAVSAEEPAIQEEISEVALQAMDADIQAEPELLEASTDSPGGEAQEDVLAAWEIPDDMLPEGLEKEPGQVPAGTEPGPVLNGDIAYDFSSIKIETPPSSTVKPSADPTKVDQEPGGSSTSGRGES